jgi:hypothetical protein
MKMKKILVILFVIGLLLTACDFNDDMRVQKEEAVKTTFDLYWGDVERFVDTEAMVVCYIYTSESSTRGAISCVPLSETTLDY